MRNIFLFFYRKLWLLKFNNTSTTVIVIIKTKRTKFKNKINYILIIWINPATKICDTYRITTGVNNLKRKFQRKTLVLPANSSDFYLWHDCSTLWILTNRCVDANQQKASTTSSVCTRRASRVPHISNRRSRLFCLYEMSDAAQTAMRVRVCVENRCCYSENGNFIVF